MTPSRTILASRLRERKEVRIDFNWFARCQRSGALGDFENFLPDGFQVVARAINETGFKPQLQIVHISGQSGNKAAKEVKGSKPDGCTLMAIHESQITTYLAGRVDFTWDAFDTVSLLTYTPSVLGANANVPFDDMKTLVDYAKKNPGKLGVGVTTGSTSQFFNLVIEDQTGTEFKYIPYEGTRERLTAILSNNVDVGEMNILTAKKYIQEGSMKALGIATEKRDPLMPELPTMKEQGVDVIYGLHRGVVAPKGTPKDVIAHYEAAFKKAMTDPAVVAAFLSATAVDSLAVTIGNVHGKYAQQHLGVAERWVRGLRLQEEVADCAARVEVQPHEVIERRNMRRKTWNAHRERVGDQLRLGDRHERARHQMQ